MSRNEKSEPRRSRSHPQNAEAGQGAGSSVAAPTAEGGDREPSRQRIAKVMARAGLCSRREAESWIADGRVSVNGEILQSAARDISSSDDVFVDGVALPAAEATRLFLFHKPRGLVTSDFDPEGRATVADFLRHHFPDAPRTVTIGRLDINTEGLLLLTNDGGLARLLELPDTGWLRRYRVRARGTIDQPSLDALTRGIEIDGISYAGIEAKLDRIQGSNCWLTMGLREGKNREIKRVLEHLGLEVNRLIRLSFGPFQLLDLAEGAVEEVRPRVLRDQLGPSLAAAAGVTFELPPNTTVREDAGGSRAAKTQPKHDESDTRVIKRSDLSRGTRSSSTVRGGRQDRATPRDQANELHESRERTNQTPRRHVSALRQDVENDGPRRRIERGTTKDRRDRPVAVERISTVRPSRPTTRHQSPSAEAKQLRIARSGSNVVQEQDRRAEKSERDRGSGSRTPRAERNTGTRHASAQRPSFRTQGEGGQASSKLRRFADNPRTDEFRPRARRDAEQANSSSAPDRRPAYRGDEAHSRFTDRNGASKRPNWKMGAHAEASEREEGGGGARSRGAGDRFRKRDRTTPSPVKDRSEPNQHFGKAQSGMERPRSEQQRTRNKPAQTDASSRTRSDASGAQRRVSKSAGPKIDRDKSFRQPRPNSRGPSSSGPSRGHSGRSGPKGRPEKPNR